MRNLLRGAFAALALLVFTASVQAKDETYQRGKHYATVAKASKPTDPKRVEVAEFFWYACPHCYAFDPVVERWKKTKAPDVDFVRYPATMGRPDGRLHAKAFYTAEVLNVFSQVHPAMFAAMHKQRQPLNNEAQISALFNRETGVMPDVFASAFNGFAVDSRARKAESLALEYGLTSVPILVIGGKYTTSAVMAGGFEESLKVADFLVEKIRQERAGK